MGKDRRRALRSDIVILSLFPGVDLLGMAFEQEGATVVHGPEWMFGRDVRDFHVPAGRFDLVIGGPPCQVFSSASQMGAESKTDRQDLIPEFIRIANEARPRAIVMENVRQAIRHAVIPRDWNVQIVSDWDCGGMTYRERAIFTWPMPIMIPPRRARNRDGVQGVDYPWNSVMASTWKRGRHDNPTNRRKGFLGGDLPLEFYAELQGAPLVTERLVEAGGTGVRQLAIHMLGNGVPLPMGRHVARQVLAAMDRME